MSNPVSGDAEAIAEVGPEGDGVLLAGFLERQEGIAASSAVLSAGAAADLADSHRVADILLRAVGVERHLGAFEGDQQFAFAPLEAGKRRIKVGAYPIGIHPEQVKSLSKRSSRSIATLSSNRSMKIIRGFPSANAATTNHFCGVLTEISRAH